jgi:transcriptional regulator with XRE-family HTH domain
MTEGSEARDVRLDERWDRVRRVGRVDNDTTIPAHLPESEIRAGIARRIRAVREERGLKAKELAARADVTAGMISQVERGSAMPSIATLLRIASALEVSVGHFFESPAPAGKVVRTHQRARWDYPSTGVHDELVSSDPTGRLQVFLSLLESGASSGPELLKHGSEAEFVLVLEGSAEIIVGTEEIALETGDSVTFSGAIPHGYRNSSEQPAKLIWVTTPATY